MQESEFHRSTGGRLAFSQYPFERLHQASQTVASAILRHPWCAEVLQAKGETVNLFGELVASMSVGQLRHRGRGT